MIHSLGGILRELCLPLMRVSEVVVRAMFRDRKIVLGLMAFWTFVLIAWALFESIPATP